LFSDPTVRQFILYLNEKRESRFIIQDLDSTMILVQPDSVSMIQQELAAFLDGNTFSALADQPAK
jgi:hypothetical protein